MHKNQLVNKEMFWCCERLLLPSALSSCLSEDDGLVTPTTTADAVVEATVADIPGVVDCTNLLRLARLALIVFVEA